MKISVKKILGSEDLDLCFSIREEVFVEGQRVPLEEDRDGLDEQSTHYLAFNGDIPAGTARVRFVDGYAKIERVAVLDAFQGRGIGKDIMNAILLDLKNNPQCQQAKLSSQVHAIPFYEKLGFEVCSDEYLDSNIPHKDMQVNV